MILNQEVCENDLIYLKGSYSFSQFVSKQSRYRLEPKRKVNYGGTSLELKINEADLNGVFFVENEGKDIIKPVWSFVNVKTLLENSSSFENLKDLLGVVLSMGRIEREPTYRNKSHSGAFWIRIWIEIGDSSTDETIFLKLYLNKKMRQVLENIIPGDVIIITQLMIKSSFDTKAFLESTNETNIFTSKDFANQKFKSCTQIIKLLQKDCLHFNFNKWDQRLISSSICGFLFPNQEKLFKNILNISYCKKFQVLNQLRNLNFLSLTRIVVKGKLQSIQHKNVQPKSLNIHLTSDSGPTIGKENLLNLPISVYGLDRNQINLIKRNKQKPIPAFKKEENYKSMTVNLVEIQLEDFVLLCEYYQDLTVLAIDQEEHLFEVEMYRYNSYDKTNPTKGVQFVLYGFHRREKISTPPSDEEEEVTSQDIASVLI